MNFLAHLHLSYPSAALMTGNFLADNLKKSEVAVLPDSVRQGITLHHEIDAFTDSHPIVKEGKKELYPQHRKYAGVILDIWYDHLLMLHWDKFHDKPFHVFELDAYRLLHSQTDKLSTKASMMVNRLLKFQWLGQYANTTGMKDVFNRVSLKVSRPELLYGVVDRLEGASNINSGFLDFYRDLSGFVDEQVAILNLQN